MKPKPAQELQVIPDRDETLLLDIGSNETGLQVRGMETWEERQLEEQPIGYDPAKF